MANECDFEQARTRRETRMSIAAYMIARGMIRPHSTERLEETIYRELDEPKTVTMIVHKTGRSEQPVRNTLQKMVESGRITKDDTGKPFIYSKKSE